MMNPLDFYRYLHGRQNGVPTRQPTWIVRGGMSRQSDNRFPKSTADVTFLSEGAAPAAWSSLVFEESLKERWLTIILFRTRISAGRLH
jgi:hypothetical protein